MGTPVEADRGDDGKLDGVKYQPGVYNGNVSIFVSFALYLLIYFGL